MGRTYALNCDRCGRTAQGDAVKALRFVGISARRMTSTHSYELEESKEVTLCPAGQRVLASLAGNRLTVAVGSRPGTCRVTAAQYVGTIVTPECNLLIRPKVSLQNLFALLGVGLPATAWQSEQFAFGGSRDLLRELSQFFARSVQHATSAGLLHAYRT